ncbi:MAG: Eco57I restriction-modification methylase domain-containing protein [Pseudomonadota bacterium]
MFEEPPSTEHELVSLAAALTAGMPLTAVERALLPNPSAKPSPPAVKRIRDAIRAGKDPLGEAFTRIRDAEERRKQGATYTPHIIVDMMISWAARNGRPGRVVDAGAGSGRYLLAAAKAFPRARLIAIETDPLAALIVRANASAIGIQGRLLVVVADYRETDIPTIAAQTLFIGNPPYLRHHDIAPQWKAWYSAETARHGVKASQLAGLHLHFFVRTRQLARAGDYGAYITAAEWLDVNYGAALRHLLLSSLGGEGIHIFDPTVAAFEDALTTSVITCFRVGRKVRNIRIGYIRKPQLLSSLLKGRAVAAAQLAASSKWTAFLFARPAAPPGRIALGDLFRVKRGQVTGNNAVWIAGPHSADIPARYRFPCVTKARELFGCGAALTETTQLREVVDLPVDLAEIGPDDLDNIERFLNWLEKAGADRSYIAGHRGAWWSVGLYDPAPILCTYMARRAPTFVRNLRAARHINIAHGLYPRDPLGGDVLDRIAAWLRGNVTTEGGRTYAGGLTKFEPREVERLRVPSLEDLAGMSVS